MERIESHLGRRLSNTLSSDSSNVLSRVDKRFHIFHVVHAPERVRLYRIKLSLEETFLVLIKLHERALLLHIIIYASIHCLRYGTEILLWVEQIKKGVASSTQSFGATQSWVLFL